MKGRPFCKPLLNGIPSQWLDYSVVVEWIEAEALLPYVTFGCGVSSGTMPERWCHMGFFIVWMRNSWQRMALRKTNRVRLLHWSYLQNELCICKKADPPLGINTNALLGLGVFWSSSMIQVVWSSVLFSSTLLVSVQGNGRIRFVKLIYCFSHRSKQLV